MSQNKFYFYTKHATKIFNEKLNNENTIQIHEEKTIDGCDRDGPKAYIYYLYVIRKNSNYNPEDDFEYIYEIYAADQYFQKGEVVEYYLYSTAKSDQLHDFKSWDDYYNFVKDD
jgi:hypothetical protein